MTTKLDQAIYSLYYKNVFPFDVIYQWLSYGNSSYFSKREFSNVTLDDIYFRYLSYDNFEDFRADVISKSPGKIDIGAVYNFKPKDQKIISSPNYKPVERELVFDIDLTDYDDVRHCCTNTKICLKCWSLVSLAILVIDTALREDFGFQHIIWVYSGRRGVHCWVCDQRARALTQAGRQAIADYLTVTRGGEGKAKKVNLSHPFHHSIERCKVMVEEYFDHVYVKEQGSQLFEKENFRNFIHMIPNNEIQKELAKWSEENRNDYDPVSSWKQVKNIIKARDYKNHLLVDIMFQHCYPRLDLNVSKGINHLLKSPFCVHPQTGYICVPIDINDLLAFNPLTVPTVSQLLDEYDQAAVHQLSSHQPIDNRSSGGDAHQSTSLYKYIKQFQKFVESMS